MPRTCSGCGVGLMPGVEMRTGMCDDCAEALVGAGRRYEDRRKP